MRKHLYLITEHPDEEQVGLIAIRSSRMQTTATKNEEGTTRTMNMDTGDTYRYKVVGMGYADFDDLEDYTDRIEDVVNKKLGELDEQYLEKAGIAGGVSA